LRTARVLLVILLVIGSSPLPGWTSNPQVIATTPRSGDGGVASGQTEIRVAFDQPMDPSSYSFITLGSGFPQVAGEPYWVNEFTIALPVHLEPGQGYWLLINSPNTTGFRSRLGEPAVPYLLAFGTADGPDFADLDEAQATRNRKAYDQVAEIMTVYYSYKDRLGIDWAEQLAKAREWLLSSPTDFLFGVRLLDVLAPANDPHLLVGINGVNLPTVWTMPTANFNLQAVVTKLANVQRWSPAVITGETEAIGYILIGGWVPEAAVAAQAIDAFRDKAAIIIDVRPNPGGDERIAQYVAGCFTDRTVDYAISRTLDPETREFTLSRVRTLYPNPECELYSGEVIVLTGPQVMSSNESFLLMMRESGATLVGAPSYGSSGNPRPYELDNGLILHVPQWQDMDINGRLVEGNGITPDILLEFAPDQFISGDPVFDAAVDLIGG